MRGWLGMPVRTSRSCGHSLIDPWCIADTILERCCMVSVDVTIQDSVTSWASQARAAGLAMRVGLWPGVGRAVTPVGGAVVGALGRTSLAAGTTTGAVTAPVVVAGTGTGAVTGAETVVDTGAGGGTGIAGGAWGRLRREALNRSTVKKPAQSSVKDSSTVPRRFGHGRCCVGP